MPDDAHVAAAEELIVAAGLAGKTPGGYAIGHGRAKPARNTPNTRQDKSPPASSRDGP